MPREELLQFIWKNRHFDHRSLKTTCGEEVIIISQGEQNYHAGPDFFNARIRIGPIVWAGNVEIHGRGSDWEKHGHQLDPAYNNVILHVVLEDHGPVFNSLGRRIHTLVFEYPQSMLLCYESLQKANSWLPCHNHIQNVSHVEMTQWLTRLQGERLDHKTMRIERLFRIRPHWESSLYLALASAFGLPINCLPFEMTASAIPYSLLYRFRDSVEDLEGILFGQAGFLEPGITSGAYASQLYSRYKEHRSKLTAYPVPRHLWKFLRLRPASFPTLRLSQFASLVHRRFPLLETILEVASVTEMEQLLKVQTSEYWNTHFLFDKCSPESPKFLGHQAIQTLIINAVVPFLFAYGRRKNQLGAINMGTSILQELKSESNHIIKKWAQIGIESKGAFESQALIQLYNVYCKQKRCLDCQIGTGIFELALHEKY